MSEPEVDQLKLWVGGAATAVICALLTLVIWWVVRDVLDVTAVQPPAGEGGLLGDGAVDDAIAAFFAALLATVVLDALLLLAPTPLRFFGWLVALVTIVVALVPWTTDGETEAQLARSIGSAIVGIVLWSLLTGAASRSLRAPSPTRW